MRIKLDPADIIFSLYIRTRAGWKCEYCQKDYSYKHQGLHCSHFWSRKKENTRFDEENCIALCRYHHQVLGHGDGRDEYKEFMIKRLGQKGYDLLCIRSNTYFKKDRKMALIKSRFLLKELEAI